MINSSTIDRLEAVISSEELADLDRVVEVGIRRLTDKLSDFWAFYALVLIPDGFSPYADSLRRVLLFTMSQEYITNLEREVWDEVWTTKFPHDLGPRTTDDGRFVSREDLNRFTQKTGITWNHVQAMLRGERPLSLSQLEQFFRHYYFPETYGGPPWADVVHGLIKLKESQTDGDRIVWIDHIHDLHHNTGTILDKFTFVDEEMLDQKRVMEPYNYLSKVDKDVRQVLSEYLRASGEPLGPRQ